jgi:hypothetical protein
LGLAALLLRVGTSLLGLANGEGEAARLGLTLRGVLALGCLPSA